MRSTAAISASSMARISSSGIPIASCLTTAIEELITLRAVRHQAPSLFELRGGSPARRRLPDRRRPGGAARPGQLGTHEFQIAPGLALLARTAQQIGRMVSHDQRRPARTEAMHVPAQAAYRGVGGEQGLRRN